MPTTIGASVYQITTTTATTTTTNNNNNTMPLQGVQLPVPAAVCGTTEGGMRSHFKTRSLPALARAFRCFIFLIFRNGSYDRKRRELRKG